MGAFGDPSWDCPKPVNSAIQVFHTSFESISCTQARHYRKGSDAVKCHDPVTARFHLDPFEILAVIGDRLPLAHNPDLEAIEVSPGVLDHLDRREVFQMRGVSDEPHELLRVATAEPMIERRILVFVASPVLEGQVGGVGVLCRKRLRLFLIW